MIKNIGPTSLISYISFTLIFFIIKNKFGFTGALWIWFFLIISGIIQFINNLYITKYPEICGAYNVSSALTATLVPWICIFGLICLCLTTISGWLRVFSNTFGVSIATLAGMNETVSKIFDKPTPTNQVVSEESLNISEAANLLYANRNKFINEVDIRDYNEDPVTKKIDWPSLYSIMNFMKIPFEGKETEIKELYQKLLLKEDAGYFLWILLIGGVSVLISTNSLLLSNCNSVEFNF